MTVQQLQPLLPVFWLWDVTHTHMRDHFETSGEVITGFSSRWHFRVLHNTSDKFPQTTTSRTYNSPNLHHEKSEQSMTADSSTVPSYARLISRHQQVILHPKLEGELNSGF